MVVGLHAAAPRMLMAWHDPIEIGESVGRDRGRSRAVRDTPPSDAPETSRPGPQQQQAEQPPPEPEKVEQKVEEKIEIPPVAGAGRRRAAAARAGQAPQPPKADAVPPAPATTAPRASARRAQAKVTSWHSKIVAQIERHKAYPRGRAGARRERRGPARLLDRPAGPRLASEVVHSSGYAALDQETLATLRRAQPFPPPPADLAGAKFDFTVPVRFNIR